LTLRPIHQTVLPVPTAPCLRTPGISVTSRFGRTPSSFPGLSPLHSCSTTRWRNIAVDRRIAYSLSCQNCIRGHRRQHQVRGLPDFALRNVVSLPASLTCLQIVLRLSFNHSSLLFDYPSLSSPLFDYPSAIFQLSFLDRNRHLQPGSVERAQ
jgi:hypothetical protein